MKTLVVFIVVAILGCQAGQCPSQDDVCTYLYKQICDDLQGLASQAGNYALGVAINYINGLNYCPDFDSQAYTTEFLKQIFYVLNVGAVREVASECTGQYSSYQPASCPADYAQLRSNVNSVVADKVGVAADHAVTNSAQTAYSTLGFVNCFNFDQSAFIAYITSYLQPAFGGLSATAVNVTTDCVTNYLENYSQN